MFRRESNLQSACVRYFRMQYPRLARLYISVPNGVPLGRASAVQFVREGLTKGVADTLLLVARGGWNGLAIEFKTEEVIYKAGRKHTQRTYQSPEQKEWEKAVTEEGWLYAVVRTFEEFEALIRNYLDGTTRRVDIKSRKPADTKEV